MKRWSERGARFAAVGLFLSLVGCGGESDPAGSETSETSTVPSTSATAGASGSSAKAGSGAAPPANGGSGAASQQAGVAAQSGGSGAASQQAGAAAGSSGRGGTDADGAGGSGGASAAPAAGSGGSGAAAPAGEATFSAIYTEILTKGATGNCMFAACHGGEPDPAVNGGLQIRAGDKAGAYKNLVNAKSPGMVCSGKTYVIPGDSAGSLLVQKLADAPPCGAKMPIGSPLTAAQIAQIAKWIDDGALDN